MSPTAGEASTASRDVSGETSPLVNARPPVWSGSASTFTGQPAASLPSGFIACTSPSEVPKITSFLLSPSRSASAGDDAPSVPSSFGKPGSRSLSLCRKKLRRSWPVSVVVGPWWSVTTTRTVKPYVSAFGRLLKFGALGGDSGPVKSVFGGNLDFRSATLTWASTPLNGWSWLVVPLHQLEVTA